MQLAASDQLLTVRLL